MMRSRLARWIVDRYPRGWRERYRDEVRALLDDGRVTWGDVIDLWRGCLSEWKIAVADPEHHPGAFDLMNGLTALMRWLGLYIAVTVPAATLGWILRERFGPPSSWVPTLGLLLALGALALSLANRIAFFRAYTKTSGSLKIWLPTLVMGLVAISWDEAPGWSFVLQSLWWTFIFAQKPFDPSDPIVAMGGRRHQLGWANMELARCLSLPETDPWRPPQLARAQAEVDRLNRELQLIYAAIRERRPLPAELTQPS